jgi:GNAT superfamily N-acetyltransferase
MTAGYSQPNEGEEDLLRDRLTLAALAAADGFHSMSAAGGGGWVSDIGGAPCWYSESYIPVFNGAGIFSDDLINGDTLKAIDAFFRHRQRPYSLITLDRLIPNAARLLAMWGYAEYDYMPLMWLHGPPQDLSQARHENKIKVERVRTATQLETYRSVLRQVFHLPMPEIELILGDNALQAPHVRHYLGYWEGEAVGTGSLVQFRSVAGIWNVGTLSSHRRRGLATEMMRQVLTEARAEGYVSSVLLASNEGVPIYTHLGYTILSTLRVFVPRERVVRAYD